MIRKVMLQEKFSSSYKIPVLLGCVPIITDALREGDAMLSYFMRVVVVELILSETTGVMCWPIGLAHEAIHAQPPHVAWCLVKSLDTSQVPQVSGEDHGFFFSFFVFSFR